MGKPICQMILILLVNLICFTIVHKKHAFAVSSSSAHSISAKHHYKPIGESTALDISANQFDSSTSIAIDSLRGGAYLLPAGWNPMGYKITALGEQFLSLGDSLECDVGRFIASLKTNRKRRSTIKDSWLEIVRASKTGQAMRIYRSIDELLDFCIKTGLID
jgi:hypothetical protein